MLTDKQIAAYEAAGFKRWTNYGRDRLYIDIKMLGAEVEFYKTGNVSDTKWQGEDVSNADGRRLLASKIFIDVATGELHVVTSFTAPYDTPEIEDVVRDLMNQIDNGCEKLSDHRIEELRESIADRMKKCFHKALLGAQEVNASGDQLATLNSHICKVVSYVENANYETLSKFSDMSDAEVIQSIVA